MTGCCCRGHRPIATSRCSTTRSDSTSPEHDVREHLAFGFGPHRCIGSTLARLQLNTFFEKFLPRVKVLELDGDVEYSKTTFVSTFKTPTHQTGAEPDLSYPGHVRRIDRHTIRHRLRSRPTRGLGIRRRRRPSRPRRVRSREYLGERCAFDTGWRPAAAQPPRSRGHDHRPVVASATFSLRSGRAVAASWRV